MYASLGQHTLRTGERVDALVVLGPDADWAEAIEPMLRHKGEPWTWQTHQLLRHVSADGFESRFFVLHRRNVPFSHLMLAETRGVALLGHVWTEQPFRRSGASGTLLELALADFRARGGQAIFLGTDFDSEPWHYYRRHGFEPVAPGSGTMARYFTAPDAFLARWFNARNPRVESLGWQHWPAAAPLFLHPEGGVVRIAATQLLGLGSGEGPLLPLIREQRRRAAEGGPPGALVLRDEAGGAVLALASCHPHPLWPDTEILDVFAYPAWWERCGELLALLQRERRTRLVAFCDGGQAEKRRLLDRAGFEPLALLPNWARAGKDGDAAVDVAVLQADPRG